MVTFEIFARSAVELLGGQTESMLPLHVEQAGQRFSPKAGANAVSAGDAQAQTGSLVTPLPWQGSGDVPSLARANAFLVTEPGREAWAAGDWIRVLLK